MGRTATERLLEVGITPRWQLFVTKRCLSELEHQLLDELLLDNNPPNMSANFPCIAINADYDVYPNIAEPAE